MSGHEGMARLEKAIKDAPTGASGPGEVRISWSDATAILALLQHPEGPPCERCGGLGRVPVGEREALAEFLDDEADEANGGAYTRDFHRAKNFRRIAALLRQPAERPQETQPWVLHSTQSGFRDQFGYEWVMADERAAPSSIAETPGQRPGMRHHFIDIMGMPDNTCSMCGMPEDHEWHVVKPTKPFKCAWCGLDEDDCRRIVSADKEGQKDG